MIVFRLGRKEYRNDISGRGAEISGGRWNEKGTPALYTAGSRALAVLEVAVHVPFGIMPVDYYMSAIKVPDDASLLQLNITDLPSKWKSNPITTRTQIFGSDLLKGNKYLVLRIPSAIVSGDYNYIINPAHPEFKSVKIKFTEPFEFDSRLFNK